jgi:hypothetical protein
MTIEILSIEAITDAITGDVSGQQVEIEIDNGGPVYQISVGVPLGEPDIQAHLDGRFAELWAYAQAKGQSQDIYVSRRVIKALALVILDEINILRGVAGLAPRSASQIEGAIRAKLKGF